MFFLSKLVCQAWGARSVVAVGSGDPGLLANYIVGFLPGRHYILSHDVRYIGCNWLASVGIGVMPEDRWAVFFVRPGIFVFPYCRFLVFERLYTTGVFGLKIKR